MFKTVDSGAKIPVYGFVGYYELDALGNVYRIGKSKPIKPFPNKWGYMLVDLSVDGIKYRKQVHRLIMMSFNPIDNMESSEVDHLDTDRRNNNLSNLEWVTHQENVDRTWGRGKGNPQRGENSSSSKLTEWDVNEICLRIENGEKQKHLAAEYGVSPQTINGIWKGRTWKFRTQEKE